MRTAIYIENGLLQVIMTPEDDYEKGVIKGIEKKDMKVSIYEGEFYQCQGGWAREKDYPDSLILSLKETTNDNE